MSKQKPTLNQVDIDLITRVLDDRLETKVREVVKEELGNFPTKDEFYNSMDQIMGELKATRQEQTILAGKSSDHEERIESLEKIHPNYQHS